MTSKNLFYFQNNNFAHVLLDKTKKLLKNKMLWLFISCIIVACMVHNSIFRYKLEHNNFVIYATNKIDPNIVYVLNEAESLLKASSLHTDKSDKYYLYICSDFKYFTILALNHYKSFAINHHLLNNIYFSKSDIKNNLIFRNATDENKRKLSSVIAHEITHTILRRRVGYLKYFFLPNWKNEGYADFVANESSYPYKEGIRKILSNSSDQNPSLKYFKYRMMISYLIRIEHKSVEEIFDSKTKEKSTEKELQNYLKIKNNIFIQYAE